GRTVAQLRARLAERPGMELASSFYNLDAAERAISEVMRANVLRIERWATSNPKYKLTLTKKISADVGYGVLRGEANPIKLNNVKVVLKYESYNGQPYYVLTSYLEK
ncbi:MAG TPA: RNase A-like domain-containing protein, partial [Trinickia sp.]|nr:RNase A-like domain-containing protein [Trinickia sp.]